jgi:hypothetical protein
MRRLIPIILCASAASAASAADSPDAALVRHLPPSEALAGSELRLVAVIDDAWVENGLIARYRWVGTGGDYQSAPFRRSSAGGYYAVIPAAAVKRPGLAYYIEGARAAHPHFGSPDDPHVVRVEREESAWAEQELHRLGNRRYSLRVDTHYQDFGGSNGTDRYARGEIDWTYRLVTGLYSINLKFGFLEGDTPTGTGPDDVIERRGYRYGYGGMRFRVRDSVWLDGRATIGMSDNGFAPGGGAQLILGDDWRTCVKLGAELSKALSYRAWITLQWDTVPGVLMSATAATTDEPRAEIDAGSYVLYEVRYPASDTLSLIGKLSYGARGNRPGGLGGGLGTELTF